MRKNQVNQSKQLYMNTYIKIQITVVDSFYVTLKHACGNNKCNQALGNN